MRLFLQVMLFLSISITTYCQQFGGNPSSTKWKQINTDTARIIFQPGIDSQAQRIASIIHRLAKEQPVSLGKKMKKIDIVLQNQTTIPNAYVQLGPYRSEFYLTPPTDNFDQGSIPWPDQLALHEYRHVHQFNNFNNGMSKVMGTLFGQEGYSLAINAAIPDWFYEGDAVYQETILSQQGRGRIPMFLNHYPALWQAGKKYSWMKLRNGSLKDYVPNHYDLGYLLVNYGYLKYGDEFWKNVTHEASAYKNLLYPFQSAIKKYTHLRYKDFIDSALNFYKSFTARSATTRDDFLLPVSKNYVSDYYFPYKVGKDSLIYLKESFRHRPAFYLKDNNGEHRIKVRDIAINNQFSYSNGRIVYSAYNNDSRWSWKNYGEIRILDIHTRKQISISKKSKYFSADINETGERVVAVTYDERANAALHILQVPSGKVLKALHAPGVASYSDPKFITDDSIVSVVRLQSGQAALGMFTLADERFKIITPASFNVVGNPSVNKGYVYFTASYQGNDDIFVLKLEDGSIYRISSGPLGNYFVNSKDGEINWSAFTAQGYQLKKMVLPADELLKKNLINDFTLREIFPVADANLANKLSQTVTQQEGRLFSVAPYSKSYQLFNFHSWRPNYEQPVYTFSVYGENVLNTMQSELYYAYNEDDHTHAMGFNGTYAGWFPHLNYGAEYMFNRAASVNNRLREWSQLDSRIGITIPLNKVSGQTFKNFAFSNFYVLRNEFNKGFFKDSVGNTRFSYLLHSFSWSQQVQQTSQQLFPRWGYSISSSMRYPLSLYNGYQFYAGGNIYLPGFMRTHSIVITGAFQQRDTSRLIFSNRIAQARGLGDYYNTNAGSRIWRVSANYQFPLFYPDWGFANIFYLQRIRTNLFFDQQKVFSNDKSFSRLFKTIGVETYFDTKWWNQHPLSFGLRLSFLLDDDPRGGNKKGNTVFELVLPVSIIPR